MGLSQHVLLPATGEAGHNQVLLQGGAQEAVLSCQSAPLPERNSSVCQTSSSSCEGHGQGLAGADTHPLHQQDQGGLEEDDLPHCLGKGEHHLVAGPDTGRVCPLSGHCSNLEEHSCCYRCLGPGVGFCSCRSGGVGRVVRVGDPAHYCSQGVDGFRVHSQEKLGLPHRQVGQLACRQSECQACLHKPGYRQGRLVVQESCGTSLAAVRAPDHCCPRVRQVSASPAGGLPEQKESHSRLASGSSFGPEAVPHVWTASGGSDGLQPIISVADVLRSHAGRGGLGRGQLGAGLGHVQPELCLPSTGHGGAGAEQDIPVQLLNSFPLGDPVEASGNMVSQSSVTLNISATQTSCQSLLSSGSSRVILSSKHALWKADEVRRVEAFWSGRNTSGGLSAGAEFIIQSGWAQGTKSVYGLGFRYFVQFCKKHKLDPLVPDPVNLINFLTYYYETKKSEYRTLNCYRSSVSSTLANDPKTGLPVGQDPLVSRFFRGIRRLRPPKVKLFPSWSISTVLKYLKTLGDSKSLSLDALLLKTCFLVALVCCKRPSCLRNMRKVPGYWELSMAGFRCQTLGIGKTEVHHISPPIVIEPFLEDPQLCPVYHLVRLNKQLDKVRPKDVTDFWLSSRKPHNPVSTQTLCKWLKKVIIDSGSLSGSARDVRSVGSSTAAQAGLDIGRILQAGDWRRMSTFQSFYFKPQRLDCISNILKVASM